MFCEAVAIYGVIMAILMTEKIEKPKSGATPIAPGSDQWEQNLASGYALFWSGLTVGISNLVCG